MNHFEDPAAQPAPGSATAIERIFDQMERRDRQLERKDERLQAMDRELAQMRATIANIQRANEDARSAYHAAQADRQRTIERLVQENRQLLDADATRTPLLEKNAALEAALSELRAATESEHERHLAALRTERDDLHDRLARDVAELQAERGRLQAEVAREAERLQAEFARSAERLGSEREQLAAISREAAERFIRSNQVEIDATRVAIADVDALIAQIHRSPIWKIKVGLSLLRNPLRSIVRSAVRR